MFSRSGMEESHPGTRTPQASSSYARRGISCDTQGQMCDPRRMLGLGLKAEQKNIFHPNELCIYAAHGEQRDMLASQWELQTLLLQAPNTAG